jgi:hypothetical protein
MMTGQPKVPPGHTNVYDVSVQRGWFEYRKVGVGSLERIDRHIREGCHVTEVRSGPTDDALGAERRAIRKIPERQRVTRARCPDLPASWGALTEVKRSFRGFNLKSVFPNSVDRTPEWKAREAVLRVRRAARPRSTQPAAR